MAPCILGGRQPSLNPDCKSTLAREVRYTLRELEFREELPASENALQVNMSNTKVENALGTSVVVRGSNSIDLSEDLPLSSKG